MSETENVINVLKGGLDDDKVKFVKVRGKVIFSKVILPDGRCAWTIPNDYDLLDQKVRAALKEGVTE